MNISLRYITLCGLLNIPFKVNNIELFLARKSEEK